MNKSQTQNEHDLINDESVEAHNADQEMSQDAEATDTTQPKEDEVGDATNDAVENTDPLEAMALQRDEFKAALQRERADFVNYKKRTEREKSELRASVVGDTTRKFLPILDDFERALASVPEDARENDWITGFSLIYRKFTDVLAQMGIEAIDPLGQPFDPNLHEAIGSEDSDEYESGAVTEVLQKGYMMDNVVVRVAMVKVAN